MTAIYRLFEAGNEDASAALRSGHRDHRSFATYQNLRGRLGMKQQEDILGIYREAEPTGVEVRFTDSENACRNENGGVNVNRELLTERSALLGGALNMFQSVGVINGNVQINMTYEDPSGNYTAAPSSED